MLSDCRQLKLLLPVHLNRILIRAHLIGNTLICLADKDANEILNAFT